MWFILPRKTMKLLNKTSIYYLLFALPVFVVCSIILYFFVSSQILDNLDESLWKERIKIEQKLKAGKSIDDIDDAISLKPTLEESVDDERVYILSDTMMYDSIEEEFLPYRILKSIVTDGKTHYLFTIQKSSIESDDLIESIIYPILILFVILLLGFFLINWYVSKKLWKPFYKTLEQLNQYKIIEKSEKFDATSIQEFSELNKTLSAMTEKMHNDYISQKQFIENASHEIQTPLAVIKNKIELLIQSTNLNESNMQIIQSVYNASNKLSSLNKALLLLSKIENNQFKDLETIEFKSLLEKTLEHFEDLIELKNIKAEKNYSSTPSKKMNPILADILISNLIQNAIRHNVKDGTIKIDLTKNTFSISNTSDSSINNTDELFNRFHKNKASAESIGLGLAIVKEICDKYKIKINYSCINKVHSIELSF